MMLPIVIPQTNLGNWAAAVNRELNSRKGNAPASFGYNDKTHAMAVGLPVTWSFAAGGGIGDMVLIQAGKTEIPSGSASGSSFPMTWVCEANVPDKVYSDYILANPSLFDSLVIDQYTRKAGVNYDPQFPEPTGSVTIDNPHGRYWRAIGGSGGSVLYADYDENAAIQKGTIVWVDPNKSYSRSFYDTGSGGSPPLGAGLWFTFKDVPAAVSGSRPSGNLYYPCYPTIPPSAEVTVSGSTYNSIYFKPMVPLSPQKFCGTNGEDVTGFGLFIPTGSVFDFTLPYP